MKSASHVYLLLRCSRLKFLENLIHQVTGKQPDIVVVDKPQRKAVVMDLMSVSDCNNRKKEHEKPEKYQGLKKTTEFEGLNGASAHRGTWCCDPPQTGKMDTVLRIPKILETLQFSGSGTQT